jgi:hypothetical protein
VSLCNAGRQSLASTERTTRASFGAERLCCAALCDLRKYVAIVGHDRIRGFGHAEFKLTEAQWALAIRKG